MEMLVFIQTVLLLSISTSAIASTKLDGVIIIDQFPSKPKPYCLIAWELMIMFILFHAQKPLGNMVIVIGRVEVMMCFCQLFFLLVEN